MKTLPKTQLLSAFAVCCIVNVLPTRAKAELPLYFVTDLAAGWLPAGYRPVGINNQGVQSYDSTSGILNQTLRGDGVTIGTLSASPGYNIFPVIGNLTDNNKTVVYLNSNLNQTIAVGDFNTGIITALATPPLNGDDDWWPQFSSDGKLVILQAGLDVGSLHPYIYNAASGWKDLGTLDGGGDGRPLAVNNQGTVVGRAEISTGATVPFVYKDGQGMVAITDGGAQVLGQATALNQSGLVTGTGNGRPFVFDSRTLEFKYIAPEAGLKAVDINAAGAVIGATQIGGSILGIPTDTAFYWDQANGLAAFDNLIGIQVDDWFITDVTDMNDLGWVLGTGFQRSDGTYHQILLRPVPEPSSTWLAFVGCTLFMRRRRRH